MKNSENEEQRKQELVPSESGRKSGNYTWMNEEKTGSKGVGVVTEAKGKDFQDGSSVSESSCFRKFK